MTKLKNPLTSFRASGTLANILTFVRRRHTDLVEKKPAPSDPQTLAQLSWRHMYQKATALWHALSSSEKQEWQSLASRKQMTGFAYFISQALRPNPGLYLPLQGGTMSGDITMAKNRLLQVPLPVDSQEPLTLEYYTATIAPALLHQGARAYHNIAQTIPHNTSTLLSFNDELYDTDEIHSTILNTARLTCKTAGKYVISICLEWPGHAVGNRRTHIVHNGATDTARWTLPSPGAVQMRYSLSTIYDLAVNDHLTVLVYQNSGIGLAIPSTANFSPHFMMQRIGA